MIVDDCVIIGVDTPRIDSGCSLEKELIELIFMNHLMVLYLIVNQVDSFHSLVCGHLS